MATTATITDARCPICRATPPPPLIRHDVVGPCALFACPTCDVRYLGAWTREVEEDDYWRDHDVGVAIYTAPDVVEELSAKYARALDALAPDLGRDARVLDVGCGIGTFLAVAESRGFQATGVDISPTAARLARDCFGHDARPGTLAGQNFPDASFDLVTLWDVIEHVFDPAELVREARRVLAPGGLLVLETPDEGAVLRLFARGVFKASLGRVRAVASCYYPAHRIYFTRRGLAALLENSGFGPPSFRRERSMRAKSRRKNLSYGLNGRAIVEEGAFALMRLMPFLGNKIIAAARRV